MMSGQRHDFVFSWPHTVDGQRFALPPHPALGHWVAQFAQEVAGAWPAIVTGCRVELQHKLDVEGLALELRLALRPGAESASEPTRVAIQVGKARRPFPIAYPN